MTDGDISLDKLPEYIDALKATIEQQAQELERVKFELGLRNEWASLHADDVIRLKQQLAASQARCREVEEDWRLEVRLHGQTKATLTARENELCTAKDQIPPDMEEDSLSVALIKLKDKLAALEPELEKRKLMQERSITDECEAEQHLVDAGISDYEDGEHGEYRGPLTQIDLCIKERDAAVQEAGRLKDALGNLTCEVCEMDMHRALDAQQASGSIYR